VVAASRVGRAAVELPRGTPVSKGVVEKPEGDCWQRRGHVNVDPAWMVDELRLCIGIWLSMLSRRMGATERAVPARNPECTGLTRCKLRWKNGGR